MLEMHVIAITVEDLNLLIKEFSKHLVTVLFLMMVVLCIIGMRIPLLQTMVSFVVVLHLALVLHMPQLGHLE
tara:strand:+ start:1952 stop:2167 length:216 start_codon:yes stop_codon:yes gene_type:complete